MCRELIEKYGIEYIYIGKLEREKYERLDEAFLRSLGEVVYEDAGACIVRTGPAN